MKGFKSLIVFVICLWAVVVVTYASQVQNERRDGNPTHLIKFQAATGCSTSTTTTSE